MSSSKGKFTGPPSSFLLIIELIPWYLLSRSITIANKLVQNHFCEKPLVQICEPIHFLFPQPDGSLRRDLFVASMKYSPIILFALATTEPQKFTPNMTSDETRSFHTQQTKVGYPSDFDPIQDGIHVQKNYKGRTWHFQGHGKRIHISDEGLILHAFPSILLSLFLAANIEIACT